MCFGNKIEALGKRFRGFLNEVLTSSAPPEEEDDADDAEPDPLIMPVTDELDLHTFRPSEVPDLLDDYLDACLEQGILSVRIIHGKGKGILKRRVRGLLMKDPRVIGFQDAPGGAGGWGATLAVLDSEKNENSV